MSFENNPMDDQPANKEEYEQWEREQNAEHYYFTFGQGHTHRHNGITLDCDSVVKIEGSYERARHRMVELFGREWAGQYSPENFKPEHFPRGVLAEEKA